MFLKKKSLVDNIYSVMKEDIILDRFNTGDILTEAKLAERFEVSKTPVREALNRLHLDGYVEVLPHKGYLVSGISFSDIHNLFQLRSILEVGIVDSVIAKMTPERLSRLDEIAETFFNATDEESFRSYSEANFKFHKYLVDTASNSLLSAYYQNVLNQLRRALLIDFKRNKFNVVTREHQELLEAIRSRDAVAAKEIAARHIEETRQRIIHI